MADDAGKKIKAEYTPSAGGSGSAAVDPKMLDDGFVPSDITPEERAKLRFREIVGGSKLALQCPYKALIEKALHDLNLFATESKSFLGEDDKKALTATRSYLLNALYDITRTANEIETKPDITQPESKLTGTQKRFSFLKSGMFEKSKSNIIEQKTSFSDDRAGDNALINPQRSIELPNINLVSPGGTKKDLYENKAEETPYALEYRTEYAPEELLSPGDYSNEEENKAVLRMYS